MTEKFVRTKDEQKRCVEIHDKFREDLLKRQLSNNEGYDKAILSLSSAALALSLTAIKFVIPLDNAEHLMLLKVSWSFFLITIICSLVAYLISNHAISKQLVIANDYYIEGLISAQSQKNIYTTINKYINHMTGVVFVVALSLVITFITLNLNGEGNMSDKENNVTKSKRVYLKDSAEIPTMQLAPGKASNSTASADIPKMELAPGTKSGDQKNSGSKEK